MILHQNSWCNGRDCRHSWCNGRDTARPAMSTELMQNRRRQQELRREEEELRERAHLVGAAVNWNARRTEVCSLSEAHSFSLSLITQPQGHSTHTRTTTYEACETSTHGCGQITAQGVGAGGDANEPERCRYEKKWVSPAGSFFLHSGRRTPPHMQRDPVE